MTFINGRTSHKYKCKYKYKLQGAFIKGRTIYKQTNDQHIFNTPSKMSKMYFYQFSRNAILAEQVTSCKIKKTALLNVHFLCDNTFLYSSLSDDSDHKLLAIKSAQYVSLAVLLLLLL